VRRKVDNPYIWLGLGELIIIAIIIIIKLIFNRLENKKLDKIINFLDRKTKENKNNTMDDKFKECLKIIENNKRD
jgi:FtsZ-interacting cell division protein ZipA